MEQARRMCEYYTHSCDRCPLGMNENPFDNPHQVSYCINIGSGKPEIFNEIEKIVLIWAEEHPAPMYPSWNEWQHKTFGDKSLPSLIKPCTFVKCNMYNSARDCKQWASCVNRPIPAEIAEKLGIRPKEVLNDAEVHRR